MNKISLSDAKARRTIKARWFANAAEVFLIVTLACCVQTAWGTGLTWPTNHFLPTFSAPAPVIDCIDISSASGAEWDLFASLEGIVNRTQPRIACVYGSAEEGKFTWLNLHHLSYSLINGYSAILKYKTSVTGLVVTDPSQPDTLNLATTLAGLNDELICDPSLLPTLTNAPYNLAIRDDLRGKFSDKYQVYHYLYTHCWPRCTHRIFAGMEPNGHGHLRDYLVAVKSAAVWLDPGDSTDAAALAPFISSMRPVGGVYMGWWPSEGNGLHWIAQYGIPVIASDWFDNASLFSGVAIPISIPPIPPAPPLQNKVYVSITLSDGDNVQYMQHHMKNNWGNAARGSVPIGWTSQPLAADLDPGMLNYYWSTATTNDCLVDGPSGGGYTHIENWSSADVAAYTKATNPYLQRSGIRTITVWDNLSAATGWAYATNCPVLLGVNDQGDGYYTAHYGALAVIGLPGGGNYASSATALFNAITNAAAGWHGSAPMFIAVQGSGWNITPADCLNIKNSLNALNSNEYVVVRPDVMFLLYRQASGLGLAGAAPYLAAQPTSQLANVGADVTFSAIGSGTAPLSYQWRLNGTNLVGATHNVCLRPNVQPSDAGNYTVLLTNNYGAVTSTVASLMINSGAPKFFTPAQTPFFALAGQPFSNSVIAAGALPLHYQWQFNGANLADGRRVSGARTNALTIVNAQAGDAGGYRIIVTNLFGSVTSSVAALTVVGSLPLRFNSNAPGWTANGSASMTASNVLTLTSPSGLGGDGSFFFQSPQYIGAFRASFTYQAGGNKAADGIAFVLQNDPRGVSALGGGGGQLGVGMPIPIMPSVELELNLYSPYGVGYTVLTNGLTAAGGANGGYHVPGGINLSSGDPITITLNYAHGQFALTFTDAVTHAVFNTHLTVGDLTQILGANTALVGFTGAYGAATSVQTISNFSFVSIPPAVIQPGGTNALILWPGAVAGYVPQWNTDLGTSNWINVTNQDFLTNGWNQMTVPMDASHRFYRLVLPTTQ